MSNADGLRLPGPTTVTPTRRTMSFGDRRGLPVRSITTRPHPADPELNQIVIDVEPVDGRFDDFDTYPEHLTLRADDEDVWSRKATFEHATIEAGTAYIRARFVLTPISEVPR